MSRDWSKIERCWHCGQIIPPKVRVGGKYRQRLYEYVAAHPEGVTNTQIMDAIYFDDPNGGPDSVNVISVYVNQINKKWLVPFGLRIRSTGGPGAIYRLVAR